MLQGGLRDAAGQPRAAELGNPPLEFNLPNKRGTVTMARWEDPNSGAGEFFINLGDSPHLDRTGDSGWALGFTVFGEVVRGLEVAETIAGLPTSVQGGMSMLTDPVVMESGALQFWAQKARANARSSTCMDAFVHAHSARAAARHRRASLFAGSSACLTHACYCAVTLA